MKTVLITRAEAQARDTAKQLQALGYKAIISPLLEIVPVAYEMPDISAYGGLIITSANSLKCISPDILDNQPLLCVGQSCGNAVARQFESVEPLIASLDPSKKYLHMRGRNVSQDMPDNVDSCVVYEAQMAERFTDEVEYGLRGNTIQCVLLYSARTAENFVRLLEKYDLVSKCSNLDLVCMSDRVVKSVQDYDFRRIVVAEKPDGSSLLQALESVS